MPEQKEEQKQRESGRGIPERAREPQGEEVQEGKKEEEPRGKRAELREPETLPSVPPPPPSPASSSPPAPPSRGKSEQLVAIERILEENLEQTFWSLPPRKQKELREKGEETARAIDRFLHAARVHASKILRAIKQWLRLIPHVNRFFLEQESKIKTDKILALHGRAKDHG